MTEPKTEHKAEQTSNSKPNREFDIIARYFRPLTNGAAGALALQDDAALLSVPDGFELAVTTDCLVGGVHFLETLSPQDIAHKVVGVNLSDLAAMGAMPKVVFLAAQLPKGIQESWIADFAEGLRAALKPSGAALMGGDTVSTPGPVAFTLTAMGHVPKGHALMRSGAQPGDVLCVTGTIGDGALGLAVLTDALSIADSAERDHLIQRYARPQPRWKLAEMMVRTRQIRAAVDISDGLLADVGHICMASGVAAVIDAPAVPLSKAVRGVLAQDPTVLNTILGGGDDYELAFCAPQNAIADLQRLANELGECITVIGRIVASDLENTAPVTVHDKAGRPIIVESQGYQHL